MIFSAFLLAASLSAGNVEFDKVASEGAARITMSRYAAQMAEKGLPANMLRDEMLRDPERYRKAAEAKELCAAYYLAKAKEFFEKESQSVRKRLSVGEGTDFRLSAGQLEALAERFAQAFDVERGDAIREQAKRIVAVTRPGVEEFDSKPEEQLRKEMTQRVVDGQKTAVFEENVYFISLNIVEPVMASARAERKRQGEYLLRARSDALAPSRLAEELKARLLANIERRAKTEDVANVWDVFPSVVSERLPQAVERRILDRFEGFVSEERLDVSVKDVEDVIAADPGSHVKASESEKVFARLYGESVLSNAHERILAAASKPERAELKEFLAGHLNGKRVISAVEKAVRREIMPKWKSARAEVAGRMAKTVWPELDNRTWTPPVELADELLARSDYRKAVASWREIGELSHLASAGKGRPIMEEASKKADEHVALAFELARSAIAAQNRIVERVQGGVLEAARSKKRSLLSKAPVLSDIVAMLTSKTQETWEESRLATLWPDGKVPENADEQHVELYPSVKRKIELVARKILEEINIPEPNDAKEKKEDPKDDPEEDEPLMEFTISVQNTSSGVEVKLLKGNTPVVERSVDRKFRQFDEAMREVSRRLGKDLLVLP